MRTATQWVFVCASTSVVSTKRCASLIASLSHSFVNCSPLSPITRSSVRLTYQKHTINFGYTLSHNNTLHSRLMASSTCSSAYRLVSTYFHHGFNDLCLVRSMRRSSCHTLTTSLSSQRHGLITSITVVICFASALTIACASNHHLSSSGMQSLVLLVTS